MNAKRFISYAALLAGVLILNGRLNAAVESDVVGYTTIQMEAGKWYQVGTPFVALNDAKGLPIGEIFNSGFAEGDTLYIFSPEKSAYSEALEWHNVDGVTGWWNPISGLQSTEPLADGQAVFIKKVADGKVTVKGKVSSDVVAEFGSEAGNAWAQIVCVYPEAKTLNEMKWTGLATGDSAYVFDTESNAYRSAIEWHTVNNVTGWYDPITGDLDATVLQPGQAVFVFKRSNGLGACAPQDKE